MNIVAVLATIFFLAIIIIPLVFVVRETLKDISSVELPPEEENKTKVGLKKRK
jgi:hypothetical protein